MGTILYTTDPNATTGFREATFEELIAGARHALAIRVRKGAVMASPNAARDYLTMRLAPRDHEVFTILFLDSRHRLIDCLEIFRGTIDGASVHPREVVKEALARNAAAVILSHNHPSGVAEPSQADELITQRLREALALDRRPSARPPDRRRRRRSRASPRGGSCDPRLREGTALIARNATQSLLGCGPASTSACWRSPGATARLVHSPKDTG